MTAHLDIDRIGFERLSENRNDAEACVAAVLRYYGLDSEDVRVAGESMLDVYNALAEAGLRVNGFQCSLAGLRSLGVPAVLHVEVKDGRSGFVVCFGFVSGRFVIGDPRRGIRRRSAARLAKRWPSRALLTVDGVRDPQASRYRLFGTDVVPFGRHRALVHSRRTDAGCVLSAAELDALMATLASRTLEEHEAWITANVGAPSGAEPGANLLSTLRKWVESGFIAPEDVLRRAVMASATDFDSPGEVTTICIPTRDRNPALETALRSYLTNVRQHGRRLRFVISSTASDEVGAQPYSPGAQLDALETEFGAEILHADDTWKRQLSARINAESACHPALLRFALFGDACCRSDYGANRNALLLATVGELCIQVDDDTLLPGFAVPELKSGIAMSSRFDPNEHWFDEPAWDSLEEVDFVALHESMLGRRPGSIIGDYGESDIVVDDLEVTLLERLLLSDARIGMTFLGHDGDAGTASNDWRLFLEGDSMARLIQPGYPERIRMRVSGRTVVRRTISDGLFCSGMNLGLDHRDLLPPFMPVGRNEDGVFSAVLGACFPNRLRGFREGYVIRHRPVEQREAFPTPLRFDGLKANDMLALLIRDLAASRASGLGRGLKWLGLQLSEIGSLEQPDFDDLLRRFIQRFIGLGICDVERAIALHAPMSDELASDLSTYLQSMEASAVRNDSAVPIDLDGSPSERARLFRRLVRAYGDLLSYWPDIVRCARHLHRASTGHAYDTTRTWRRRDQVIH